MPIRKKKQISESNNERINPRHRQFHSLIYCLMLSFILSFSFSIFGKELGSWDFQKDAKGWQANKQAVVSDISRRKGNKSLQIKQQQDSEQESSWLSPILKSTGKPVVVSFWAADNYTKQPDFSYSAAVGLAKVEDGKTANPQKWQYIPWDDARKEQWWGALTPDGLLWKYYEFTCSPPAENYRIKFFWPKTIARGECNITDVQVREADPSVKKETRKVAEKSREKAKTEYTLEISTPTSGNLFYADDPLRFDLLLFDPSGKAISGLQKPIIEYDITDFTGELIAQGKMPFSNPATIKTITPQRAKNLYKSIVISDAKAKAIGREFFLHAVLRDGNKLLGEETVTYGVVNPRRIDPKDYNKCLFVHFQGKGKGLPNKESKHKRQSLRDKVGVSFEHDWDYLGWKQAQPKFPGPIKIKPVPDFPKIIYCPNLEQIRGRTLKHPWGEVGVMAPEGASFEDPLRPGCKTFDIDGYVAYIVARIKAQRNAIVLVVPSGLERNLDKRTIELQKKAYTAIKKEFPDLPVGMMIFGLFGNPSKQAEIFMKEKLYEYADFVDDHMYSPSMDWTEWKKLKKAVKAKGKDIYLISTEFSRVGGKDQLQRSRAMVNSHLEAWANGMRWITYFNVAATADTPVLREAAPGDGFQWVQNVKRPKISKMLDTRQIPTRSTMPLLQAMTYYNLVQNFEGAKFQIMLKPSDDTVCYVFSKKGKTICAFHLTKQKSPRNLAILTDVPFTAQGILGKVNYFEPKTAAILSVTKNPTVLIFAKEIPQLYKANTAKKVLKTFPSSDKLPVLAKNTTTDLKLKIPGVFNGFPAEITGSIGKIKTKTIKVKIADHQQTDLVLPLTIGNQIKPGNHLLENKIVADKKLVGIMKLPITISDIISLQLSGIPKLPDQEPAVAVTISNLSKQAINGKLTLDNKYFGLDKTPAAMLKSYSIPAKEKATVVFPLPSDQVKLNSSYLMTAKLNDQNGTKVTKTEEISFAASVKTTNPIVIDGDLADWKLTELCPVPAERYHSSWGKKTKNPADLSASVFSRWDNNYLYFAAIVTDDKAINRANDVNIWQDDNIMLGLYPWGLKYNESLKDGYYREHLGLCADGQARVFRVGNVPNGQQDSKGVKVAVKRTGKKYIYEWAYPKAAITPMQLKPDAKFRLSLAAIDRDVNKNEWGTLAAVQLGGFNLSIDAQPSKWREFVLVDK